MTNLTTDKQLDKHLNPVKSGEDNTSLELSTENNGAKITGSLDIKGGLTADGNTKVSNGDVTIDSVKKIYLDGGGDTYITETGGDILRLVVGGEPLIILLEDGGGASDKVIIPERTPLYFDGGGNTFIQEVGADELILDVGGNRMMHLTESGMNGNSCWFRANVAVGLARNEATFSATGVIASGGTDDTDIDFRFGNKFRLEMTGDITNVNLIFPDMAMNCLLVCTTNGDHDVTNWKVYAANESAATGADVLWAGGSVPAFTSSGIDIVSFYWDYEEQQCYGVASLAFAAP